MCFLLLTSPFLPILPILVIMAGADRDDALQCERPFHLNCLSPPLTNVPEGEWFCDECQLHSEPHYLPGPNVLKDTSGANGEDGGKGKKGKGRPKK